MSTPFTTGEIVGISIGGAVILIVWILALFGCIRFYILKESGGGEDGSGMQGIKVERPVRRLIAK